MAQQQHHQQAAASQHQQQQPSSPPLSGLAANLRPHYFSSTPKRAATNTASILGGKHHPQAPSAVASAYPTPPASPQLGSTPMPTPQHAALATMASQTLVQRLGSAFWQAFSGSSPASPSTPSARAPAWDAEKVRRVLEGTAVVRVVDVDPPPPPTAASVVEAAAVASKESKEVQTQACCKLTAACDTGLSVLVESMRALTLGKK